MSIALPSHIFREYDIRGVADRDLSDTVAHAIGRGFGAMLFESGGKAPDQEMRVAVGRDCRLSSPRLFAALVKGLREAGVSVVDVGEGPTPMLYFAAHHLGTDGAVMITGSHNPGDENGFKLMRGKASFFGPEIQKLKERISRQDLPTRTEGKLEQQDVQEAYVAVMKERFDFTNKRLSFVVDAGNGAGGPLALRTMKALGLEPDPLFCEMDGRFPNHHPDPTVLKNIEALALRVKATHARVGIAYDGDADRLGAVDENGEVIWGDKLMILFSRALLKDRPGATILGEVKCSQTLYDDIAKHGGSPVVWKTGHSLIKTKMKETGALLAGEMSGHLFFADRYFGYDDAIYASLRLLEILANDSRPLSSMLADVPKTFTTPELRVDCPDAIKFQVVAAVTKRFKQAGNPVLDIDGARISFGGGAGGTSDVGAPPKWGLVRASNTGPILVMRFEAGSSEELEAIRREVEGVVAEERSKLAV